MTCQAGTVAEVTDDHWDGTHPEDVLAGVAGPELTEWHVLVEETVGVGRESHRWMFTRTWPCANREEALRLGVRVAGEYKPEHPMSPKDRRIFQVGEDSWLVQVTGATADFHFRVSVARLLGE